MLKHGYFRIVEVYWNYDDTKNNIKETMSLKIPYLCDVHKNKNTLSLSLQSPSLPSHLQTHPSGLSIFDKVLYIFTLMQFLSLSLTLSQLSFPYMVMVSSFENSTPTAIK